MTHNVSIEFNNNQIQYYPGNIVSGIVTFNLFEDVSSVSEVRISLGGKAKLRWTEQVNKQTVVYSNKERYFKSKTQVLNGNQCNNQLKKGQHKYAFSFQLPTNIPSSFYFNSNAKASVEYAAKGFIIRSGFNSNIKGKTLITVLGTTPPECVNPLEPSSGRDDKYICCWCCKQGPIKGEISLDKTLFLPGEVVIINANVENLSNTPIQVTNLNIRRKIKLKAVLKTKQFSDVLLTFPFESCVPRSSLNLNNKQIQLPLETAPTHLPNCSIIIPEYYAELEGVINGCHINLRVYAKMIIGATIPASFPPPPNPVATVYSEPPAYNIATSGNMFENQPPTAPTAPAADDKPSNGSYYDWNQPAFTYS